MTSKVKLYSGTYKNYSDEIYKAIRSETFGEDIGQNSWLTADEYRNIFSLLGLTNKTRVLEIASGSGGPAVFMSKETGCHLTGLEYDRNGVDNSLKLAEENGLAESMEFIHGDASEKLPFDDGTFDAVVSIDAINHLKNRDKVLKEFFRVLKKGGRLIYTDPIVVTGILTNEEIAIRSSIGYFIFAPLGENERLLERAGFKDIRSDDATENMSSVSLKWFNAREKRKAELLKFEEEDNCNGLQKFFKMVHTLSFEKRLSRIMFNAVK
ncbi:MAG: methyltransferase domain-containing protein [Ignavibacteria bacterium]|nr:methyltransferase domain-containing protein [Ignavibacteria bacterium]